MIKLFYSEPESLFVVSGKYINEFEELLKNEKNLNNILTFSGFNYSKGKYLKVSAFTNESYKNRFYILRSINFGLLITILTAISFVFVDLPFFKFTRTMSGYLFWFFENVIDLISDIFDPLNITLISIIFLINIFSIKKTLKTSYKKKIIESKFSTTSETINQTLVYYNLIFYHIIVSILFSGLICHILKFIIGAARPKYFFLEGFERLNHFNLLHKANALPSGHTQAAFTIVMLLIIYINRYKLTLLLIAFLIGLSRIFLSMHFFSDIILGAYVGSVGPIITYIFLFKDKFELINFDQVLKPKVFFKLLWYKFFI